MSLVEVMIALAVLGLLVVPIMMAFMNTQIYARKIDKQNEVNAVTRTVIQIVNDNFKNAVLIADIEGHAVDLDGDESTPETFLDIIKAAKKDSSKKVTVDNLPIIESGTLSKKYKYSITYDVKYDNSAYPGVYNFLITVMDYNSGRTENKLKIAVNIDD